MIEYFTVIFLKEVEDFLVSLESKIRNKIVYNIDKSRYLLDPKLFKKLNEASGNLGQCINQWITGCWHFGINLMGIIL